MKKIITILAILGLVSCGGGSNNDQGTSVTFLGYTDDCVDPPVANLAGVTEPLSFDDEPSSFAGGVIAGMVLNNNLETQFIRTENAFFTYFIPGASIQPPATSSVAGIVIAKGGVGGSTAGCVETLIVPPEIRQWIVLNRNFLPELPFTMEVAGYVTVISQAGDRFDTNEVKFLVQFTPDVVIPPGGEGTDSEATPEPDIIDEGSSSGDEGLDGTDTGTEDTDSTGGDSQL